MNNSNLSDYDLIISLSEQLCNMAPDPDVTELEEKTRAYLKALEQYFVKLDIDKQKKSEQHIEHIKEIISVHKTVTGLLKRKKEDISTDLKRLHAGKEMQNTYPQMMS